MGLNPVAAALLALGLVATLGTDPAGAGKKDERTAGAGARPAETVMLAAPLPRPLFKTHFNSGAGKHVFRDRAWDLARIRQAFNAVIVDDGNPQLVDDVRAAGLAALIEFDEKARFARGESIAPTVEAVIRQVREHPGTISAIRVADRVNEKLPPEKALDYLEQTGGVFHREIPGVPVLVDVEDWELTCGMRGQSSCLAHIADEYRFCVDRVLERIYRSGFVDGFELSVNLKNDDARAMAAAMRRARSMFPRPFLLYARTASLSFDNRTYPGDARRARRQVAAYIQAPLAAGTDGIDLWAWHRPWKNQLRTFLDEDASTNPLWDAMTRAYATAAPRLVRNP